MTLAALLSCVSGLYIERGTDCRFTREELLSRLSEEAGRLRIELVELEPGIFAVHPVGRPTPLYTLLSRRRGFRG